jgi:hypothetical protein
MVPSARRIREGHLIAITMAIALAFCGLVTETMLQSHRDTWERASQAARNLNRAVNEEIGRTVESLELSLQAVADNSLLPGVGELDPEIRNRLLFDRATRAKHLGAILVFDEHGNLAIDSRSGKPGPGNFADREYFAVHRDNPGLGLHVSSPLRGRLSQQWIVAVSLRL